MLQNVLLDCYIRPVQISRKSAQNKLKYWKSSYLSLSSPVNAQISVIELVKNQSEKDTSLVILYNLNLLS